MCKSSQTIVHFAKCSTIQLLIHKFLALCSLFMFAPFHSVFLNFNSAPARSLAQFRTSNNRQHKLNTWPFVPIFYLSMTLVGYFSRILSVCVYFFCVSILLLFRCKTFFRSNEEAKSTLFSQVLFFSHLQILARNLRTTMMFTHHFKHNKLRPPQKVDRSNKHTKIECLTCIYRSIKWLLWTSSDSVQLEYQCVCTVYSTKNGIIIH